MKKIRKEKEGKNKRGIKHQIQSKISLGIALIMAVIINPFHKESI